MVKTTNFIDFNDDLSDVLPWSDDVIADEIEEFSDPDDEQNDTTYGDAFLSFVSPQDDLPPEFIENQVIRALEEYTLDELLMENEMGETEAVSILYELGYIGLPEFIEDEDEEVQDTEED